MIRGFTNGCFRLIHYGHIEFFRECKYNCDWLTVGLNSDSSVRQLKGNPIVHQNDRRAILESIKYIDEVIIFNELTPYKLIQEVRPDIIFKGGDYSKEEVVGKDLADVLIVPYLDGYSTTSLISRIKHDLS